MYNHCFSSIHLTPWHTREDLHNWPKEKVDTVVPFNSGKGEEEQNHLHLTQLFTYVMCKISNRLVEQRGLL